MKKVLFTLATVAMLFATSCKKENINAPEKPVDDNEFLCVIEPNANPQNAPSINGGMRTMAELVNNRAVWQKGDQIAYFGPAYDDSHSSIEGYKHVLTCKTFGEGEKGSAYFEAEGTHFGQGNHEAFYPAELLADDPDADHYTLALPAVQTIDPERNANNLPMYGVGSGSHYLTFYNLCGVLKIVVPVASNKIELTADKALCGPINIVANYTAQTTGTDDKYKTITIKAKENGKFNKDYEVLAAIPAETYNSLSIKFYCDDRLVAEKTTTNHLTIARNTIKSVNTNIIEGLYFTAGQSGATIKLCPFFINGRPQVTTALDYVLQYAVYNSDYTVSTPWTDYTMNVADGTSTSITLTQGQKVFFRSESDFVNGRKFSRGNTDYYHFEISNGTASVGGNIMYLIDSDGDASTVSAQCFYRLFMSCSNLTSAKDLLLPATTIDKQCYADMFKNCTQLTAAPDLPATTLAESCYSSMFEGCYSLSTAPDLPATTLAKSCYSSMFKSCSHLTTAPELSVKTLVESCYQSMFESCTTLVNAPELPATTLAKSCYKSMFQSCSGNLVAPELPAEELVTECYSMMFNACGASAPTNFASVKMKATRIASGASACLDGWLYQTGQYLSNKILTVSNSVTADPNSEIWQMINAQTPIDGATTTTSKGWTIQNENGDELRKADGNPGEATK